MFTCLINIDYFGVFSGKSKEAEIKRINKELANIRSKFKGNNHCLWASCLVRQMNNSFNDIHTIALSIGNYEDRQMDNSFNDIHTIALSICNYEDDHLGVCNFCYQPIEKPPKSG